LRIGLLLLEGAHTVKELAAALDVPPTRLYYHVRMLEEHGLIEVVDRRMVSGIEERRYRSIEEAWNMLEFPESGADTEDAVAATLAAVKAEMAVALHDAPDTMTAIPSFALTELMLSPAELELVQERVAALMDDFGYHRENAPADARRYRFLIAGYLSPRVPNA
jgi:predicted ArsR family transcriptional regulator